MEPDDFPEQQPPGEDPLACSDEGAPAEPAQQAGISPWLIAAAAAAAYFVLRKEPRK